MSLSITHRGQKLSQEQLDALLPVLNDNMHGKIKQGHFHAACDAALEAAGCPIKQEKKPC